MICMFYAEDQTSCIAYLSSDAVGALMIMFIVLLGVYFLNGVCRHELLQEGCTQLPNFLNGVCRHELLLG